jgi:hypothetical protein
MALANDTTSGSKPSTDSGFYSGLAKTPAAHPQPPKDKYAEHLGDGPVGKVVNAGSDGKF